METKKPFRRRYYVRNLWYYNWYKWPVGLLVAFYGNMRQVKVKLIDSLLNWEGNQLFSIQKRVSSMYLALPIWLVKNWATAWSSKSNLLMQSIFLNETVEDIRKEGDLFTITTSRQVHQSKAVIIAMGGGAFKPRALDITEGAEDFDNVQRYHVSNIQQYEGQQVTVLGGGDSAVDWALAFDKIAPTTIIHLLFWITFVL